MAFQSVPNTVEAVLHFTGLNANMVNVLHFRFNGTYEQSDLDQLAANVDAVVGSAYLPICAVGVTYVETTVKGLQDENDFQSSSSTNTGPGTAAGDLTLPFNVTLCATLRTGKTGRSARGRFYAMPASADALTADNTFGTTYVTALELAVSDLFSAGDSDGWHGVVVSRFFNKAERAVGVTFNITDVVVRNGTSDSQRGRLPHGH